MSGKKLFAIVHRVIVVAILLSSLFLIGIISLVYLAYGSADLKPHASEVFCISVVVLILAIFYIAKVIKPWDQIK